MMRGFVYGGFENRHHSSRSAMKTIRDVRRQLATGRFEFTRHAFRRVIERNISEQEIREASTDAELIEDYPRINIRQVRCCSVSRPVDGPYTFRYHSPRRN
jgi:hypothetical protein